MLHVIYTVTPDLRDRLLAIDSLRRAILTTPIPPKLERMLRFQSTMDRMFGALSLSSLSLTKREVKDAITAPPKRPTLIVRDILGYKEAHDVIAADWVANPKPITVGTLEALALLALPHMKDRIPKDIRTVETPAQQLFNWIGTQNDHPVIEAAIAHAELTRILGSDASRIAFLVAELTLARHGLDMRGLFAIESQLIIAPDSYTRALKTIDTHGQLTAWLEYYAKTVLSGMEALRRQITDSSVQIHTDLPQKFFDLSDRQKKILSLLEEPTLRVTNRDVQKRFRVSQITASRDLTKLASLGLLYPHGKGRSVSYTRV